jgi:hypothetical protein
MLFFSFVNAFVWGSAFSATIATSPFVDFSVQNTPRFLEREAVKAISQAFSGPRVDKRNTVIKNSTTLDKSWNDAVLFSLYADISFAHRFS